MSYRQQFEQTIQAILGACPVPATDGRTLWPDSLTDEGVAYGEQEQLDAEEAACWYLSAAALIRMCDGDLGVPLATRILRAARDHASRNALGQALLEALARMEEERFDWIKANHETQGAALRAIRPVPAGLDHVDDFTPPPDWPDLLERLLDEPRHTASG